MLEIAAALVGLLLLWLVARAVRGLVHGAMSRRRIQPEVVTLISRIAFVGVIGVGLVVGATFVGQGQLGASGVLAATILAALGIQDILRNYVSGLYLLTERRLNIGDVVEFATYSGTIIEIRFRVTYIRAEDGSLVIVPNSELFNSTVVVKANKIAAESDRPPVPKTEGAAVPAASGTSRKRRA
ncbi:MAG TPA: mechanosensitive ion channel domain-containing protein [Candidatus Dormibacteraeota bacterium]|nr:mechanosensitive ion channel domain-containing protein [Candidatus Dormibacteraeota bacterium]